MKTERPPRNRHQRKGRKQEHLDMGEGPATPSNRCGAKSIGTSDRKAQSNGGGEAAKGTEKSARWPLWWVGGVVLVCLVIGSRKTESDRLYKSGLEALNCSDYATAVTCFGEVVRRKPENADAWCGLGKCYWNMNRFVEAADSYDQAIELKPQFYRAHLGLAESFLSLRDYSRAANAFEQASRLHADNCEPLYYLAICYRAIGRSAEADIAYNKVRQINPKAVDFMDQAAAKGLLMSFDEQIQ